MAEHLTYYQIQGYPNDFTKFCSLNGIEIDNNFFTLEGRDIKSISVEGTYLVLNLYNGKKLKGEISTIISGLKAGDGIDKDAFNEENTITTNASLIETKHILEVSGEGVGSYNPGDIIPVGTPVEEILRKMLIKVYEPSTEVPYINLVLKVNGINASSTYEVGTIPTNCVLGVTYNPGRFVGNEHWAYSKNAQCPATQTRYSLNGGPIATVSGTGGTQYNFNAVSNPLNEGTYNFSAVTDYNRSQASANRSDGSQSEVFIPAGTTDSSSKSFKAAYKYFYGYIPFNANAVYDDIIPNAAALNAMNLNTGFCEINGTTKISYMESSATKSSLVLVLPEKYKTITRTENSLYAPVVISEKWKQQTHESGGSRTLLQITDYRVGGIDTVYYVYILHSLLPIRYNNIEFAHV